MYIDDDDYDVVDNKSHRQTNLLTLHCKSTCVDIWMYMNVRVLIKFILLNCMHTTIMKFPTTIDQFKTHSNRKYTDDNAILMEYEHTLIHPQY